MKKIIQSTLCIFMCITILFGFSGVALAKNSTTPVILVHGLGANPIYENVGTSDENEIQNMGLGDVKTIVLKLLATKGILSNVLTMAMPDKNTDADEFINALSELVEQASVVNCTSSGEVKSNQGINNFWTDSLANHKSYWQDAVGSERGIARQLCNTIGAKNVYVFNYDWRQDICESARQLNDFVKTVKKNTGAKKVSLVGCSLGGSVLSAYVDAYKGNKDIERCIFVNAAFMGVDVARMYALDLQIDSDAILEYLQCLEKTVDGGSYSALFKVIRAAGDVRIKYLADYLGELCKDKKSVKKLYNEVIKPWIGYIPALWECIPYNSFDTAVKKCSEIGFLDKKSDLYKKIKKYHSVQGRLKSNLKALKKQGVGVAIFAGYGTMAIPVTSKGYNQSDYLIDTKYASAGATVAKYGKKLSAKGKYVSKDKIVNAKTCYLPDNTWFIDNLQHVRFKFGTESTELVANLACGKVKCTISAVKKKYNISQFSRADAQQNLSDVK